MWEKLSDFKECYPVETDEYVTARDLADEPAFNWWVNQILKKRGEVTELTANVIAQSMYSMCDKDGYQVLLFDAIVDHKRDETAMTKADQNFVGANGK